MTPRETENNAYANFGVTNKEHYGMLWYFLEWLLNGYWHSENRFDERIQVTREDKKRLCSQGVKITSPSP